MFIGNGDLNEEYVTMWSTPGVCPSYFCNRGTTNLIQKIGARGFGAIGQELSGTVVTAWGSKTIHRRRTVVREGTPTVSLMRLLARRINSTFGPV